MPRWSFTSRVAAEAAQAQITAALPPDVDWQGQRAVPQITNRWADVTVTTDNQFTIVTHPTLPMPAGGRPMTDAVFKTIAPALKAASAKP